MSIKKKLFSLDFYKYNRKEYLKKIEVDQRINALFRGCDQLNINIKTGYEWKYIDTYRKYQANQSRLIGLFYKNKLKKLSRKSGIDFEFNPYIGEGLIIGHWGRIIINGETKIGDNFFITHGVTIGRDIKGKRKGVPTIGNRVCIRANSTVVGNITIGDDVLIAPNTFVNFDVPSHSIVIGNPATIHSRESATEGHIPML